MMEASNVHHNDFHSALKLVYIGGAITMILSPFFEPALTESAPGY